MQTERNTKARNIAERFAPSPSRREVIAGSAVAVLGLGAAAVDTEATAGQDGASALAQEWADAVRAMLRAERDACKAQDRVDTEVYRHRSPLADRPEDPEPASFAAEETRAELEDITCRQSRELARRMFAAHDRAEAEAKRNPAYREALAAHEKSVAEWEAKCAADAELRRKAEARHGAEHAEQAATERTRAFWKAQEAIFRAPINSEKDAIAVLCAMMFAADQAHGFFDVVNGEGHDEAFKPEIADTLERLKPFLPGSPASLQRHWNI